MLSKVNKWSTTVCRRQQLGFMEKWEVLSKIIKQPIFQLWSAQFKAHISFLSKCYSKFLLWLEEIAFLFLSTSRVVHLKIPLNKSLRKPCTVLNTSNPVSCWRYSYQERFRENSWIQTYSSSPGHILKYNTLIVFLF